MPRPFLPYFACIVLVLASHLILFLPLDQLQALTDEDQLVESASAIFYLFTILGFLAAYFNSRGKGMRLGRIRTPRNTVFLLLALFFLVALGEEISWGQRIFNWQTPSSFQKHNIQGETNLHNLSFVNGQNPDGSLKSGLAAMLTSHRIFYAIVVGWALLIPLGHRYWAWMRRKLDDLNFPIHPIWLGVLTIAVLLLGKFLKLIVQHPSDDWGHAVSELAETNFALMTALLGFYWFTQTSREKRLLRNHEHTSVNLPS